jgi:hypothetical protein
MGSTASIDQNKVSYRLALRQQDWLCAAAHKPDLRPSEFLRRLLDETIDRSDNDRDRQQ